MGIQYKDDVLLLNDEQQPTIAYRNKKWHLFGCTTLDDSALSPISSIPTLTSESEFSINEALGATYPFTSQQTDPPMPSSGSAQPATDAHGSVAYQYIDIISWGQIFDSASIAPV